MKILVTGADGPQGATVAEDLSEMHEVAAIGAGSDRAACAQVDLGDPEQVVPFLTEVEAVVHAVSLDVADVSGDQSEQHLLDDIARGTYVLTTSAIAAGIPRLVLLSRLDLLAAYPEEYLVTADWRPLPGTDAESMAVYSAELVCREIARTGRIEVKCLRVAPLGQSEGTTAADVNGAINQALLDPAVVRGHHWELRHVASGGRFAHSSWHPPTPQGA